jgi:HEPN domain-containing protein
MRYKLSSEWFKQSDYDFKSAKYMFKGGRNIYAVFMCHLSIEKALKGLYTDKLKTNAPKTHDLVYLCQKIELEIPEGQKYFLENLNALSVPTRYPDELSKLIKQYNKSRTEGIIKSTRGLLLWAKQLRKKQ